MKPVILVGGAALAFVAMAQPRQATSGAQVRPLDPKRSTVTVHVFKAGLFRAFADNHVIEAPLSEGSVDDSATPSVSIAIDARTMHVLDPGLSPKDRGEVQTRMLGPDVLDVDRFQHIRFRSVSIQREGDHWSVRGELALHGQSRSITVSVVREQGHYKGSASLKQSDYGITPITIAGGAVKVKDELKIDFDLVTAEATRAEQATPGARSPSR